MNEEAINGKWRTILCKDFDVKKSGVPMSGPLGTRINNFLRRLPADVTLGELVDAGHTFWMMYPGVGRACQEHLIASVNFVAGEQVVKKKSTCRSAIPTVRDSKVAMPRIVARGMKEPPKRLDELAKEETPKPISPVVVEQPLNDQSLRKLAEKFNVRVHGKRLQESVATETSKRMEHNRDMMTIGQLRRLCDAQSNLIKSLEVEKKNLTRELATIKEALADLIKC